ncbi:MAG: threonine--tRNA ligase, partial [Chloroflexota bacterium]|nr:threonine--tRNA ligase [Chloroflexota bacterium]
GGFEDLCRGPHLASTGLIGPIKLLSVAGAYWRGDEHRQMLQRIYGTAWENQADLDQYLWKMQEAAKRDHRKLGKEMDLFSTNPNIGAGLVLWHPAGSIIRHQIETFWNEEHIKRGYQLVYTPHLASEEIYKISGHLEAYGDMMYSPMDIDGNPYRAKPMNCPGHICIYQSSMRSYRDLPVRYAELGTVYRYERSGALHGLLRVRGFTQDDSHIFCRPDQLKQEVNGVLDLTEFMMKTFGYRYHAYLATRPAKSIGADEEWAFATNALKEVLEERNMPYDVDEGGGVFYAPKIDVKLWDALGREWQGPTCQVDLNLPVRFNITYIAEDGKEHRAIM